ncbi:MAG: hypothetical protein QXH60_02390 [Candidatus Pacearchaeota archaeon]
MPNSITALFIFITHLFNVYAFQGSSGNYSSDNKLDSFSQGNASSESFSQRLIGGVKTVGQYTTGIFSGRFGILSMVRTLSINITSHQSFSEIIRGNDSFPGEDDKNYVSNSITFVARVFDGGTNESIKEAECYFYDNGVLFGNSTTDSSGYCSANFSKSSLSVGSRNIFVNYSISTEDTKNSLSSEINISIVRYITSLAVGNYRTFGCATGISTCYYSGDNATLLINITKINNTGTLSYDPKNISANATNNAEIVYPNGNFFYPVGTNNITKIGTGIYSANISVNQSFGSQIRWEVLISDDNYLNFLSTAIHSDVEICAGDFGKFSKFSGCSNGVKTRSKIDSTNCKQVEIQSCSSGAGGMECIPSWSLWSAWSSCQNGEEKRTRSDGCGNNETEIRPCSCQPNWQCNDWGECIENPNLSPGFNSNNGTIIQFSPYQIRECIDLNECDIEEGKPQEIQQCVAGLLIDYTPKNTYLIVANKTSINFYVKATKEDSSQISIKWYIDSEFKNSISGGGSVENSFSNIFLKDSKVKAEIEVDGLIQNIIWDVTISSNATLECEEKWYCSWTKCDGNYKYATSCTDLNECGTNLFKPMKEECSCIPEYKCDEWNACETDYNIKEILSGKPSLKALQSRTCTEITFCDDEDDILLENRECSISVPIRIEKRQWCFEEYIEIYDNKTNEFVSRFKERVVDNIKRVDIAFTTTESEGVCPYCFDRIKNFDEDDIDCGGACGECIIIEEFFDYLYFVKILLWTLMIFLTTLMIYERSLVIRDFKLEKIKVGLKIRDKFISIKEGILKKINLPETRIKFHLSYIFGRKGLRK